MSFEMRTIAGCRLRISIDPESLAPELAREEAVLLLAKTIELFPQGQRRSVLALVRELACIEAEHEAPDPQLRLALKHRAKAARRVAGDYAAKRLRERKAAR